MNLILGNQYKGIVDTGIEYLCNVLRQNKVKYIFNF